MADVNPALLQQFCQDLPKVELHAHLNGSLSEDTFRALHKLKVDEGIDDEVNVFLEQFTINHGDSRTLSDCFEVFRFAHALVDSPSAVRLATVRTVLEFFADGCVYLELRSTPRANGNMTKMGYIEAMIRGIRDAKDSISEPSITVCVIVSIDRSTPLEQASENVDAALAMFKQYPDYICGVEISGNPSKGNISDFIPLLDKARQAGLKVTVHTAEVPNQSEVATILQWHPDRVGHAICVHPSTGGSQTIWEQFLDAKIPTELCLTSNIKSRSIDNYNEHHFKYLWEAGHPLSLATDDKGVFSTSLSEEYRLCAETFSLTRSQIAHLAESAIDQTFAGNAIKKRLKDRVQLFKSLNSI